jgi:hypothetical protein
MGSGLRTVVWLLRQLCLLCCGALLWSVVRNVLKQGFVGSVPNKRRPAVSGKKLRSKPPARPAPPAPVTPASRLPSPPAANAGMPFLLMINPRPRDRLRSRLPNHPSPTAGLTTGRGRAGKHSVGGE